MHADAVGGSADYSNSLSSAEKLDESTATWSYIADLSPGRFGVAVAAAGGFLFAIGGAASTATLATLYNTNAKYDPSTNAARRGADGMNGDERIEKERKNSWFRVILGLIFQL